MGDYIKKTRNFGSIPENAILATADVVVFYSSIPHEVVLKALREALGKREEHTISTNELIRMTEFVLKNNYFQFNGQLKHKLSGTAIVPSLLHLTRVCLWIKLKLLSLKPKTYSLWCSLDILTIFFYLDTGEQELQTFLCSLNEFHTDNKFRYESRKESIAFLELKVSFKDSKIITDLHVKSNCCHQYFHYLSAHPNYTKRSVVCIQTLHISRLYSY